MNSTDPLPRTPSVRIVLVIHGLCIVVDWVNKSNQDSKLYGLIGESLKRLRRSRSANLIVSDNPWLFEGLTIWPLDHRKSSVLPFNRLTRSPRHCPSPRDLAALLRPSPFVRICACPPRSIAPTPTRPDEGI
jgi:hypothetical protein